MTELAHPDDRVIELLALGGLDEEADIADHVSTCDVCAAKLVAEARLELALGELHAFRAGDRHVAKPPFARVYFAPILVLAAAAAIFFVLRGRQTSPAPELRADPTVAAPALAPLAPAVASGPPAPVASGPPADLEAVIAKLRPSLKKCFRPNGEATRAEVMMDITIAPDGSVSNVELVSRVGADDAMTECLVTTVRGAKFEGTGSTFHVRVPFTFVAN